MVLHKDCPVVVEKVKLKEKMLSKYQLKIIEDNNFSFSKNKNLISNLENKIKYKFRIKTQNFV